VGGVGEVGQGMRRGCWGERLGPDYGKEYGVGGGWGGSVGENARRLITNKSGEN
jgi:hypothetical protein